MKRDIAALIISTLALLFTISSFWWMNWRRGKLIVGKPRSYAARGAQTENLIITLPLVFFNEGAAAIVVQNLQLLLLQEGETRPLFFNATLEKLLKDESRSFATQFPVRGREAVTLICEFQRSPGNLVFESKRYPIELQAILDDRNEWETLARFDLNIIDSAIPAINRQYLAHNNYAV
jgi:hypothetical protein